ncbi:hypothetical protein F4779DRAFT_171760 [Xylariaceae sp. FL0662B]|nr:hypothetical protein F4779DRAFT_171760 [Xylariaceae sp. FL0662B]
MSLAQPVAKDGFSFAGDLFAEASGHNRHRRATPAELKEHFKTGSDKDHPAHWFEAQLIHYGLQPSKTKSVARMRLYDAVNVGKLSVPAHIQKLESDLKKEWIKREREAKKALNATSSSATKGKGTKRSAEAANVDLTVSVGGVNITVSANNSSQSATKKAKTAKSTATSKSVKKEPSTKAPKTSTPKSTPKPKPKASASGSKPGPSTQTKGPSTAAPRKKQTARRGGISQGPSRGGGTTASPRPPIPKQTARRGGGTLAAGRTPASAQNPVVIDDDDDFGYGGPPPPYTEYPDYDSRDDYSDGSPRRVGYYDDDTDDSPRHVGYHDVDTDDDSVGMELRPLGLLNGRYDLESRYVTSEWGHTNLTLILTLSGRELWGQFDLGVVSGIIHFNERPWESSEQPVYFKWRGRELEGPMIYGNGNEGSIRFLGDGRIEGDLDFMSIEFTGSRRSGQGTRSEIDAGAMRREWDDYNEWEYEQENRARWF